MHRPTRFPSSVLIAATTVSAVALVSGLAAQIPSTPPKPALQCYVIWPDTGSRPRFLPVHLVLGANPIGGIGFRTAAVFPTRMYQRAGDEEDTLYEVELLRSKMELLWPPLCCRLPLRRLVRSGISV